MARNEDVSIPPSEMTLLTLSHNLESQCKTLNNRLNTLLELFEDQHKQKCETVNKVAEAPPEDIFSTLYRTYDRLEDLISIVEIFQNRIGYYKELSQPQFAEVYPQDHLGKGIGR